MDEVQQRCIAIIASSKSLPPDAVKLASTFDELAIDSLDKINISFEVEEAFHIEIPDDALGSLKTVGDVVTGVRGLLAAKTASSSELTAKGSQ